MIFTETELPGAFLVRPEPIEDHRGFFARIWCDREAEKAGLGVRWVQSSVSYNRRKGTLRGMHWQAPPHDEVKLVRCIAGAIHDVIIDLRPESPTWRRHLAVELSAGNRQMLYVPEGFAHGFETLEDHTVVEYRMSEFYEPDSARGLRWDDPAFGIRWPLDDPIITDRDRTYPDFQPERGP